jgi:hypothetical protein
MRSLGVLDRLIVKLTLPIRCWRLALPLATASSIALPACVFGFDDSPVFGYPLYYAALGVRLLHAVFEDRGWSGNAVWLVSYFLLTNFGSSHGTS